MKKLFLLLCPFILIICCFSCEKKISLSIPDIELPSEEPMTELEKLPAITSEGANTFGCLINGEAWTPKGSFFANHNFDIYHGSVFNGVFIDMFRRKGNDLPTEYVTFGFRLVPNSMEIDTAQNVNFSLGPFVCQEYDRSLNYNFNITKLDRTNKIISGTFDFTLFVQEGEECQDTLRVTDGRFDAVYRF